MSARRAASVDPSGNIPRASSRTRPSSGRTACGRPSCCCTRWRRPRCPGIRAVEFYLALRRLGKEVLPFDYNGETARIAQAAQPEGLHHPPAAILRSLPEGRSGPGMDGEGRPVPRARTAPSSPPWGSKHWSECIFNAETQRTQRKRRENQWDKAPPCPSERSADTSIRARTPPVLSLLCASLCVLCVSALKSHSIIAT